LQGSADSINVCRLASGFFVRQSQAENPPSGCARGFIRRFPKKAPAKSFLDPTDAFAFQLYFATRPFLCIFMIFRKQAL
jgi:hypothetical protein